MGRADKFVTKAGDLRKQDSWLFTEALFRDSVVLWFVSDHTIDHMYGRLPSSRVLHGPAQVPHEPAREPQNEPEKGPLAHGNCVPAPFGAQKFPRLISFSMSMSSAWSATSFFRRRFSPSSSRRRLASSGLSSP